MKWLLEPQETFVSRNEITGILEALNEDPDRLERLLMETAPVLEVILKHAPETGLPWGVRMARRFEDKLPDAIEILALGLLAGSLLAGRDRKVLRLKHDWNWDDILDGHDP